MHLAHLDGNRKHALIDHLKNTAEMAKRFAEPFDSQSWAYLAGLWHDLGKFSDAFQKMILAASTSDGYVDGPHGKVDHSSAGAVLAKNSFNDDRGFPIAFAVAGHHMGLQDIFDLRDRLDRKRGILEEAKRGGAPEEVLIQDQTRNLLPPDFFACIKEPDRYKRSYEFWVRMLFSALADADFLDAESFFDGSKTLKRSRFTFDSVFKEFWVKFTGYIEGLQRKNPNSPVNHVRKKILKECIAAAEEPQGMFSLTAPTGAGKTLAAMGFGLKHVLKHHLRRIIVVLPFTTIIEQNGSVYKKIFGESSVLEHHSNIDPGNETFWSELASENWDAPIVVTTNVQFFESLLANRSSGCRKLHNIPASAVIFDEVQAFPIHHLNTILDLLNELVERYKVSILLSTATQPALKDRPFPGQKFRGLSSVKEIVSTPSIHFQRLKRVEIVWPADVSLAKSWEEIAEEIARYPTVLAIVNKRADARILARLLPPDTFHLSTLMCAKHRFEVLDTVRTLLHQKEPVRLVSTQLVEAGVDLDFPVVFRALAGLDSVAQAAGRCNREGELDIPGRVSVFVPPTRSPRGVLRSAEDITKSMLQENPELDPLTPEIYENYFRSLYFTQPQDQRDIQKKRESICFKTVAENFRMIETSGKEAIVVPYGESGEYLERIRPNEPIDRKLLRSLQHYTVELYGAECESLRKKGGIRAVGELILTVAPGFYHAYDHRFGLVTDTAMLQDPDSLIL